MSDKTIDELLAESVTSGDWGPKYDPAHPENGGVIGTPLTFNRLITDNEQQLIERYLAELYDIYLPAPDATQAALL